MLSLHCHYHSITQTDDHGVIKVEVAQKVAMDNFATEMWEKEAMNEIVEKCAAKVSESKRENVDTNGIKCSIRPAELAYCVWRQTFMTCPEDKQTKNPPCDKLRQSMKTSHVNSH